MFNEHEEDQDLLIDRKAAAEIPEEATIRNWARNQRAFISSVINGLEAEREAAAAAVRAEGGQAVLFEEFGGRDTDPLNAYCNEVETSQIYIGILGDRYGKPLPTRFSPTHTEYRHAEEHGLRIAIWTSPSKNRNGPQQEFLDEARAFHVVPTFKSAEDLGQQIRKRLREIAAEDLTPWAKWGHIIFRSKEITERNDQITVKAQVRDLVVAKALQELSTENTGGRSERKFTWGGWCRNVRPTAFRTTTTTNRATGVQIQFEVIEAWNDGFRITETADHSTEELNAMLVQTALFGGPHPLAGSGMESMTKIADPIGPLRKARVPDEIVRNLTELMITESLVGSGRAVSVKTFRLGTMTKGGRKLELTWIPATPYETGGMNRPKTITGYVNL